MRTFTDEDLALQRVYRWERDRAGCIFLTQPYDRGKVREWTWAEAMAESRRIAAFLKDQGWEPGSRVAILSKNCAWWIMADLAIWMAGHVSVPVYPSLRGESVRQILVHSGAKACFIGPTDERETAQQGIPQGVCSIRFPNATGGDGADWDDVIAAQAPLEGQPVRSADDLATIIYTSGTTGVPKGVMHAFRGFRFDAAILADILGLTPEDRVLSYLPLAHIVERAGVEGTAYFLGYHLYFSEGIETFLQDLNRARPTIFISVPRLLLKFQQGVFEKVPRRKLERLFKVPIVRASVKRRILRQLGLDSVRHAACGAAPLPTEILMWYRMLGLDLAEGYGMTETMITHLPPPGHMRAGYVGPPLEGVECKTGESAELLVKSPMNLLGYYRDPEATRAAFTEDGFFRTGDVVQIEADSQLRIIGRVKEQFKTSKGKYVAPAPIEGRFLSNPAVEACCLMGTGLPSPCAIVVLSPEARKRCDDLQVRKEIEESLRLLREQVNLQLDPFERISFVAVVDGPWSVQNGILTPTLKMRRSALEDRYWPFLEDWEKQNRPVVWETPL